ncbi:hypothetical protein ID850_15000 [Xenorhabdus sp. Flor]|uniref:hypothetical protein n=1 Tax=Xenorhabdus cabanillasii TaxID=351673 RepID=UPI0019B52E37|nr:hypothetical protein [Xenorhabdus sp. Flor]MBD2816036.1 hypothetical protein [Xenorhabdus sp. Flor]
MVATIITVFVIFLNSTAITDVMVIDTIAKIPCYQLASQANFNKLQKYVKSSPHTVQENKQINAPHSYSAQNCRVLESKAESPIHDHYYFSKDKNGVINVKVIPVTGHRSFLMSKDLFITKNKYQRKFHQLIKKSARKIINFFKRDSFK